VKKAFILFIVIMLILTVFMSSALADKPQDKPKDNTQQSEGSDEQEPDSEDGPKMPNEKRDAKTLFKETTRPLIDEVHANREEWGLLGEEQSILGDGIDAQIEAIIAGGLALDESAIALIKEKCEQIKDLKAAMKGTKDEIHDLWRTYIDAKKVSDIDAATAALNELIAKQETRIEIRIQIIAIMNDLAASIGVTETVPEPDVTQEGEV